MSAIQSNAALTLTFTDIGDDVIMQASGSVDLALGTFLGDESFPVSQQRLISPLGFQSTAEAGAGVNPAEIINGVDLVSTRFGNENTGTYVSGSGDFRISGSQLFTYQTADSGILDNNVKDATITQSNVRILFSGHSFASLGLDKFTLDTDVGLWKSSAAAGEEGTINIRVSSVPEPSSLTLIAIGMLGFLKRRR